MPSPTAMALRPCFPYLLSSTLAGRRGPTSRRRARPGIDGHGVVSHLEEQLERDVAVIRDKVRELADLALRGLEDSLRALTTSNTRLAYSAILRDSRIDELESLIDNRCVEFMVRHIPVAKQLRFAHSVAKICSELERVGDYAESINRQAILLSRATYTPDFGKYSELANLAIEMIRQAVRAFLDEDLELAESTIAMEPRANKLHQEIYGLLVSEQPQTPEDLRTLFALLSVANRFERVADQASNICEEVFYIVSGEIVKHTLQKDVKVLFVSSSNSCRSLMAEGIARTIAGKRFDFFSAGIDAEPPDPRAVDFLARKGIDVSGHESTAIDDVGIDLDRFQAVVAIGAEAAKATPKVGYRTILVEWDLPDPSTVAGDDATVAQAYAAVFDELVDRITELVEGLHGTIEKLHPGERSHA